MRSRLKTACILAVFGIILAAAVVLLGQTTVARAAPDDGRGLDCLSCHPREMQYHDKLGQGNRACWVCHDKADMRVLHLLDGTALALNDSAPLCGQCHAARYQAWLEGTHGLPSLELSGAKAQCSLCHHQHAPQIVFEGITLPHPTPQPAPDQPSAPLLVLMVTASVLLVALGIVVVKRR